MLKGLNLVPFGHVQQLLIKQPFGLLHAGLVTPEGGYEIEQRGNGQNNDHQEDPNRFHGW